jgi:hypothetical protein
MEPAGTQGVFGGFIQAGRVRQQPLRTKDTRKPL